MEQELKFTVDLNKFINTTVKEQTKRAIERECSYLIRDSGLLDKEIEKRVKAYMASDDFKKALDAAFAKVTEKLPGVLAARLLDAL